MSLKRTPLFECHQQLGARLVDYAGWEMPVQYAGVKAEHLAVRASAGLFDVSHMGELAVSGPTSLAELNRLITNDLASIDNGQALYTCCCNERGTLIDDLIVYREEEDSWLVVCNAANLDRVRAHFETELHSAKLLDRSAELSLIALQGPKAGDIMSGLGVSSLPRRFRFQDSVVSGIPCRVARTGYTGEDGFELFVAAERAAELWNALVQKGTPAGLMPIGLAARDTLRLEARLSLYGNDIDETTTPLEAGLSWTVKFTKPDFIGKDALLLQRQQGLGRTLVGFEMTGRGIARHGYPILDLEGRAVGLCTSGAPSPTLGKNIGLGYVPLALSAVGSAIQVDCRGKAVAAVVVPTPFYRRSNQT